MPATYEKIATTTLGSATSTITFDSIPGTYTDLRIAMFALGSTNGIGAMCRINSDTGTNYSNTSLSGSGASATSARATSVTPWDFEPGAAAVGLNTTNPTLYTLDIFSYAGSTNKTALLTTSSDRNGSGAVIRAVLLWRSTAAITRLDILTSSSTFAAGTTATLYGILKA